MQLLAPLCPSASCSSTPAVSTYYCLIIEHSSSAPTHSREQCTPLHSLGCTVIVHGEGKVREMMLLSWLLQLFPASVWLSLPLQESTFSSCEEGSNIAVTCHLVDVYAFSTHQWVTYWEIRLFEGSFVSEPQWYWQGLSSNDLRTTHTKTNI